MKHRPVIAAMALIWSATGSRGDDTQFPAPSVSRPCYFGTSLFTVMNLVPDADPPRFFQVNIGYQLTPKNRLSVEAITWRYYRPLGIPWAKSGASPDKA